MGREDRHSTGQQFGSVEELLKNTDQLKENLGEKVENNKEMGVAVQAPRDHHDRCSGLPSARMTLPQEINKDALRELFAELEFRRLGEQLGLDGPAPPGSDSDQDFEEAIRQAGLFDEAGGISRKRRRKQRLLPTRKPFAKSRTRTRPPSRRRS